jgi:cell division protein FtsL
MGGNVTQIQSRKLLTDSFQSAPDEKTDKPQGRVLDFSNGVYSNLESVYTSLESLKQKAAKLNKTWLVFLSLGFMVLLSALGLVYVKHLSYKAFAELQVLTQEQENLQDEWRKLLLEDGNIGSYARLEAAAIEQLSMHLPGGGEAQVLNLRPDNFARSVSQR